MTTNRAFSRTTVVLSIVLCLCIQVHPQTVSPKSVCYPDAPPVLVDNVRSIAQDIANKNTTTGLSALFPDIFFYTVADAVAPSDDDIPLRGIAAYRYLGETARTDKQIGASARSSGSTTAVEKPGFAELLGFAIENGAIQKQVNGTTLSLSTTPYAFLAWANKADTAKLYQDYAFFTKLGLSASFNISNQNSPLGSVNEKQLTEYSIRYRLAGDRSTRSKKFEGIWNDKIKPNIQRRLNVVTRGEDLLDKDDNLTPLWKTKREDLRKQIQTYLDAPANGSKDTNLKAQEIGELILCYLKSSVFSLIKSGQIKVSDVTRSVINSELVPALADAHKNLEQARTLLDQYLDELNSSPITTFAFTNHRDTTNSNYSEFQLLFEGNITKPMKLVANAGVSIYSKPDPMKNQQSVRDFGGAISLEGKANSPFLIDTADLSKLTYSFSGRFQRMLENRNMPMKKADIAVAQFKIEIPIAKGMSIPLSFTYANATELIKESHVRGNFGVTFDVDKFFALARRVVNP